jgi:hypothetical protein
VTIWQKKALKKSQKQAKIIGFSPAKQVVTSFISINNTILASITKYMKENI